MMIHYQSSWPVDEIDLDIDDLPHHDCATEWWYVNTHVEIADGHQFSIFASFFKTFKSRDKITNVPNYAYFLTWAISDITHKKYYQFSRVDQESPSIALDVLKNVKNKLVREAMKEVYQKGNVPYPDKMFKTKVISRDDKLYLDFSGSIFTKTKTNQYLLKLYDEESKLGCELIFTPKTKVVRHGEDGVVKGAQAEDMFYYFIPNCHVTGTILIDDKQNPVENGKGWYDHEFGGDTEKTTVHEMKIATGWNWIAIQFDNGTQLSAYNLTDMDTNKPMGQLAVIIDSKGQRTIYKDFVFMPVPQNTWTSHHTFNQYPTLWQLTIPSVKLDLTITVNFPEQEFITFILTSLSFWEGSCIVKGTYQSKPISGTAYIERQGFPTVNTVDEFFEGVSLEVTKQIQTIIPNKPSYNDWHNLIAVRKSSGFLDGIDFDGLADFLVKPIRVISDRRGKAWRPYALLACCNAVGGDFERYLPLLVVELIHVGSLIVDDVEDHSVLRRGETTSHLIFGESIALNSGTFCYFIPQVLFERLFAHLPPVTVCKIDNLYFEALRAAHAGQALDLAGNSTLVHEILTKKAHPSVLEERLIAIHRLKSGAAASVLARMGAILGNGTDIQINALGDYMQSIGVAFQIMDDVLNLTGFKGKQKVQGEDLAEGKITFPVAKAGSILPFDEYCHLLKRIKAKPSQEEEIQDIIRILEQSGSIKAASQHAKEMIETAWQQLDPLIDDSLEKIMLRVYGYHVIERHY